MQSPIRSLLSFAILMSATAAAAPADAASSMPALKANPLLGYTQGQCGAYLGLNGWGNASSVKGGPAGAQIVQGDIGATIGYGCPIGGTPGNFWFIEGSFDWANINGTQNGLGLTGPAHFEQRIALGSPLSSILGLLPSNPFSGLATPATPLCPANVTCGNQYPFIFASLHEQDISGQFGLAQNREWLVFAGLGIGLESRWSNGLAVDVWAQFTMDSTGMALGPQKSISIGNGGTSGVTFKF